MLAKLLKRKRAPGALPAKDVKSVFSRSHFNGAEYHGDRLEANQWAFPKGTWLQTRLQRERLR